MGRLHQCPKFDGDIFFGWIIELQFSITKTQTIKTEDMNNLGR